MPSQKPKYVYKNTHSGLTEEPGLKPKNLENPKTFHTKPINQNEIKTRYIHICNVKNARTVKQNPEIRSPRSTKKPNLSRNFWPIINIQQYKLLTKHTNTSFCFKKTKYEYGR